MIIAINGYKDSGKDTVGKIINYLLIDGEKRFESFQEFEKFYKEGIAKYPFKIKKFATKTTEAFKVITGIDYHDLPREAKEEIRPTYVEFAETLKCVLNEDVWVKALMKHYIAAGGKMIGGSTKYEVNKDYYPKWVITDLRFPIELEAIKAVQGVTIRVDKIDSDWTYLPHEARHVWANVDGNKYYCEKGKSKEETLKELIKEITDLGRLKAKSNTETALDEFKLDYTIDNNGTIEELIEQVRVILIELKLL